VTFLFTDIEGSTRLWEQHPAEMGPALKAHDGVVRGAIERHAGAVFATGGDGFAAAFNDPADAMRASLDAQDALGLEKADGEIQLRVRMAIHTGAAEARGGDYFGPTLNRAARLMAAGHGGQILVSESTRALLDGDVWSLRDLGRHRLKDLTQPQQVFQVGADPFAPLTCLDGAIGNLPRDRTSFVGRERLVDDVAAALQEVPLVTLAGVGGVGKTRLAIHVARRFAESSGDGAWLCPLVEAQDEAAVVEVIMAALQVRAESGPTPLESLISWLSGRQLVLVLDNCEHVLDVVAEIVEDILDRAPNVAILATSREGLALSGERLFAISSLELPKPGVSAESEAVKLFIARARDVQPDFDPGPAVMETVAEICRRLDGIPLAIELAAARLDALAPADILVHLDQRFELLTGGRSRRRERHQTLRHTVDWSYDLLDEIEQVVFRRLSVFAATFELDAAVAVCAAFEMPRMLVVETLTSLCRKSLVQVDQGDGRHRYRYLETIRAYAEELNERSGELDTAMEALTAWFITWARNFPTLVLQGRIDAACTTVDLEEPNLRRVLTWTVEHDRISTVCALFEPFGSVIVWGGERLADLAAECVDLVGLDDQTNTDALFALAGFQAYERLDHLAVRQLTDRAFVSASRYGEIAVASQMVRWLSDLVLGSDVSSRSRLTATADRLTAEQYLDQIRLLAATAAHDAIVADCERADADISRLRERAAQYNLAYYEMLAELYAGMTDRHRDLDGAMSHLLLAAPLHGPSRSFIGDVIRQEIGVVSILRDDHRVAAAHGAHLARMADRDGRVNFAALAALILTGPLTQIGDPEFAAELLGWVTSTRIFNTYAATEREHATTRVRGALTTEAFDQHFATGTETSHAVIAARLLDRLSTIEALVETGGHDA
jgi:predicted ATPase